jgi:hypothetical protein
MRRVRKKYPIENEKLLMLSEVCLGVRQEVAMDSL